MLCRLRPSRKCAQDCDTVWPFGAASRCERLWAALQSSEVRVCGWLVALIFLVPTPGIQKEARRYNTQRSGRGLRGHRRRIAAHRPTAIARWAHGIAARLSNQAGPPRVRAPAGCLYEKRGVSCSCRRFASGCHFHDNPFDLDQHVIPTKGRTRQQIGRASCRERV